MYICIWIQEPFHPWAILLRHSPCCSQIVLQPLSQLSVLLLNVPFSWSYLYSWIDVYSCTPSMRLEMCCFYNAFVLMLMAIMKGFLSWIATSSGNAFCESSKPFPIDQSDVAGPRPQSASEVFEICVVTSRLKRLISPMALEWCNQNWKACLECRDLAVLELVVHHPSTKHIPTCTSCLMTRFKGESHQCCCLVSHRAYGVWGPQLNISMKPS